MIYDSGGGHAVVIVGYGVENNIYYWIAQNYAEDNLDDNSERKQINIYINEVSKDCKIKFSANEEMNSSFEMYYNQSEN